MPDYRREHNLKTLDCIGRQIDAANDHLHNASASSEPMFHVIDAMKQLASAVADLTEFAKSKEQ